MSYFGNFKMQYDIKVWQCKCHARHIRQIKLKNKIRDNLVILDKYDLTDAAPKIWHLKYMYVDYY